MTAEQREDMKGLTKQDKIAYYVRNIWLPLMKEQVLKKGKNVKVDDETEPKFGGKRKTAEKAQWKQKRMQQN